ncbi:MAG: phosphoribosylformylglycinamidine cyclo-ligase, partial [Alphaproteobacteria bacterium]|nr:phosphoribosylformylglycinamidine cyclo-ligase [Alphaproteobacteria bacterium]
TFNCGIGMIAVTAPAAAESVARQLQEAGETVFTIGTIVKQADPSRDTVMRNMASQWAG